MALFLNIRDLMSLTAAHTIHTVKMFGRRHVCLSRAVLLTSSRPFGFDLAQILSVSTGITSAEKLKAKKPFVVSSKLDIHFISTTLTSWTFFGISKRGNKLTYITVTVSMIFSVRRGRTVRVTLSPIDAPYSQV